MLSESQATTFDAVVVPHFEAARRLARRLLRDEHDAEDAVQDALLRALRYFRTFGGGDGRAWFLRIVRNTCYGWYRKGLQASMGPFDEERHSGAGPQADPESLLIKAGHVTSVTRAMSGLPDPLHQLLVLREIEGLSYRELADVVGIPVGTVMSRLSRARAALRGALDNELAQPGLPSPPRRQARSSTPAVRQRASRASEPRERSPICPSLSIGRIG